MEGSRGGWRGVEEGEKSRGEWGGGGEQRRVEGRRGEWRGVEESGGK